MYNWIKDGCGLACPPMVQLFWSDWPGKSCGGGGGEGAPPPLSSLTPCCPASFPRKSLEYEKSGVRNSPWRSEPGVWLATQNWPNLLTPHGLWRHAFKTVHNCGLRRNLPVLTWHEKTDALPAILLHLELCPLQLEIGKWKLEAD